ncbi:MAG: hypothetical protein WCG78_04645, partial [Candidatus Omnitrophota bacterium]
NQSANREEEERNLDIVLQNSTLRSEIESNRSAFHEALTAPGAQIVVGEGARLDLQGRRVMDSFGLTLEFCRMCRERSLEARVVEVATEAGDDFIAQVRVGGEWRNIRIAPSPLPVLHVRYVLDEADEMEQAYARLTRGLDLSSRAGQTAFYDSGSDGIVTARAVISTGDERTVRPDTTIRLAVMVSFANDTGTVRRRAEVSVETSARRLIAMGAALMAGAAVAPDDSALITVTETGASDQSPGIFADQVARARALLHEMISRLTMSEIPASRTEETAQRNQVLSAI